MTEPSRLRRHLYHLALAGDWEGAQAEGRYRVSTRGATLDDVGFVHTCFAGQLPGVASRYYADVTGPLVLLTIDPDLLGVPVALERVDGGELFPHVCGPLDVAAVVQVRPLHRDADGRLDLPATP